MTVEGESLNFIHSTIPRTREISKYPTLPLIKSLKVSIYPNSIIRPCTYNNHNLGNLGLVTTDIEYILCCCEIVSQVSSNVRGLIL